ncbi:hypothetical protein VST7929_02654 [Vibrio stylophorae]|uniref:Methyltransferase type 12 domain-containing protein n=1 Tax=Vibrio stylophorae TaxID=659351 RepID=A0ABM8ZWR6_9VIBR|nr:class I SAM-dependent methyltransferase [Vibrio stylophorae]CAH0534704.1 hypothetical protein VST7929_02654 [Vibrio stylophorae]
MSKSRIYGHKLDIDLLHTHDFFECRAKNRSDNLLNITMYQDKTPELAIIRDAYEKELVLPLLKLSETSRYLDVGCGVGRWCKLLVDNGGEYHGVDFSQSLINIARDEFKGRSNVRFSVMAAEHITLDSIDERDKFSHLIISGVFLYLNDSSLELFLSRVNDCLYENGSLIYIREPMALLERLTLNDYWSDELQAKYSAIYRTVDEIKGFLSPLISSGFKIHKDEWLYPLELNNRKDTSQRYIILERV